MTSEGAETRTIYQEIDHYIKENLPRYISELGTLCAKPVPNNSRRSRSELDDTTRQIIAMFKDRGLRVDNWTSGKRVVLFARTDFRPHSNTILSYNTYQNLLPTEMDEWRSAIFGLNARDGHLYAQGVADNRANLVARLAALEAWREVYGSVPVNVKFLVEGRGDFGHSLLEGLLSEKAEALKADACMWDSGENTPDGVPVLSLGQKGLLAVELRSKTLSQDGDSALSGIMPSGGWRLIWALSAIKNDNEDIQIEGFDEDIHVPAHEDSSFLMQTVKHYTNRLEERRKAFGLDEYLMGLSGLPLLITEFFTPTANISGLNAGSMSDGYKPLLISSASARIDFRLVPDQNPDKILTQLQKHLKARGYTDIEVTPLDLSEKPSRTLPTHPFVKLATESATQSAGVTPLVIPLSPTVGPMSAFKAALQDIPIICAGTSYDGSRQNTPDENIREADFLNHIKFMTRLLGNLEEYQKPVPLFKSSPNGVALPDKVSVAVPALKPDAPVPTEE
jgi:acetylornithine deacetylase/succinyl-diaminopimelate desuccinylase-like protein